MSKSAYFSLLSRRLGGWMPAFSLLIIAQLFLVSCGAGSNELVSSAAATATATSSGNGMSVSVASQPTARPAHVPSPVSTVAPSSGNALATPPGSPLPTEAQCAASVRRSSFEPRSQNAQANQSVPTAQQIANLSPWNDSMGQSVQADSLRRQITGNFTGTTDEILQWTACKWGVSPDLVRAEAVIESYWRQSTQGDYTGDQTLCPPGTWDGKGCYQSYGLLQIKYTYNRSAWPMSRDDSAFNAEYVYGILRACYEGWTTYLSSNTPLPGYTPYHAGDIWGCLGRWFSGSWYDQGAVDYIQKVKTTLADKTWLQAGF